MTRGARRVATAAATALVALSLGPAEAAADPVIAAAGDIACDPADPGYNGGAGTSARCRQRATSDLLVGAGLAAVLPLGDIQYDSPTASRINAVYAPTLTARTSTGSNSSAPSRRAAPSAPPSPPAGRGRP